MKEACRHLNEFSEAITVLEPINCIVCRSRQIQRRHTVNQYRLARCSDCGLEFLSPQPSQKELEILYQNYYSSWNLDRLADEVSAMKKDTFRNFLSQLPPAVKHGRFLDIGCATGEMLALAKEKGFDVYGVEISPEGKQFCRDLFGEEKILGKNLEVGDFPESYFDVITLSDVLEHIPDPPAFLGILQQIMKPQGILLIVTPDTSSWTRRLTGRYWPHYKTEHLYYFNQTNLSEMCTAHFDQLTVKRAYKSLTLNYITGILQGYHRNLLTGALTQLIQFLPAQWKSHFFRLYIGEMFMLLQKRA